MDNTSQVIAYSALYVGLITFGFTDDLYVGASLAVFHGLAWTAFRFIHCEIDNP